MLGKPQENWLHGMIRIYMNDDAAIIRPPIRILLELLHLQYLPALLMQRQTLSSVVTVRVIQLSMMLSSVAPCCCNFKRPAWPCLSGLHHWPKSSHCPITPVHRNQITGEREREMRTPHGPPDSSCSAARTSLLFVHKTDDIQGRHIISMHW